MTQAEVLVPSWSLPAAARRVQPIALLFSLAIAGVLVAAVVGKLQSGLKSPTDYAVVILEPLFALALVVFHARRAVWWASALLFAAFAGFSATALLYGRPCGCFGEWLSTRETLAIDLVVIAVSLFFATGSSANATIGAMVTALAVAASGGSAFNILTAPPPPEKFERAQGSTPADKVLASEAMQDVRSSPETGPAWLVYFYNPECEVCMKHLPSFEQDMQAHATDRGMRIRLVNLLELDKQYNLDPEPDLSKKKGVPIWAWDPAPPLTALIRAGRIEKRWGPHETPEPGAVRAQIAAGTLDLSGGQRVPSSVGNAASKAEAGTLAVARLMASAKMADVAHAQAGGPSWLVYIYNPECPKCLDHLALYRQFEEQNPTDSPLRTRIFSMTDLQSELGVPIYEWPGVPTTLLVRGGKVVRTWNETSIPDPFEAWALESKGRSIR